MNGKSNFQFVLCAFIKYVILITTAIAAAEEIVATAQCHVPISASAAASNIIIIDMHSISSLHVHCTPSHTHTHTQTQNAIITNPKMRSHNAPALESIKPDNQTGTKQLDFLIWAMLIVCLIYAVSRLNQQQNCV